MADTQTDVLVAVYQDLDKATRDFDALMQIVKAKQVEIEGAILVTHDASGGVTVVQTMATIWAARVWDGARAPAWWWDSSRRRCWRRWWSAASRAG